MKLIHQKNSDFAELPTLPDLCSDTARSHFHQIQLERKFTNQKSMISLNDKLFEAITDETTTENGPLTDRTNPNSLASVQQHNPIKQEKPRSLSDKQTGNKQNLKPNQKNPPLTNVQRLKFLALIVAKFTNHTFTKLLVHLSKTSTADKYIRLIYSIFKLYRALQQKNNLGLISKQLLTTRRIIQWDTKYQLIKQLTDDNVEGFDFGYKIFELIGNLFDFGSFWLGMLGANSKGLEDFAQTMYSWQDDCYFYQCMIELMLAAKSLVKNLKKYYGQQYSEQKRFELLHQVTVIKESEVELKTKLNILKSNNNKTKNPKNQISKLFEHRIQQKIVQKQTQITKLQRSFDSWEELEKEKLRNDIMKSSLKILKYLCDVRTSYNNYSWKGYGLDPVFGGKLSIGSSLIGMILIWGF